MLENILNAITRLLMDRLGRNLGGHIPSCARYVCHDEVAMATAVAQQRRIEHSAVMGVWRPNAREPILTKFGTQQQVRTAMTVMRSNIKIFKNSKWRTAAMLELYSKCHNSPTNRPTGTQLGWSHSIMSPTCPPYDAVAMATAAAYQRRIEHSAVMGVWRPNA